MWSIKREVWITQGKKIKYGEKIKRLQILCGAVVLALTGMVAFTDYQAAKIFRGNYLKRGEENVKEETLTVKDEDNNIYPFTYEVNAQKYTPEEAREQLERAIDELEEQMAGKNSSLDHVTMDLNLPMRIEKRQIDITWKSDTPAVLGSDGKIKKEVMEPILVKLEAELWCQEEQASFQTQVRVCPAAYSGEELFQKELAREVEKADERTDEEEYLILPNEVNGRKITWQRSRQNRWYVVLVFGGGFVAVLPYYFQKKEAEKRQKRKQQMQGDYPLIVSKMAVLVGAGMTVKEAWQKIVEDYEKSGLGKEGHYAYAEMEYSLREMKSGIPEVESYGNFGERCQAAEYGKLGSLLARNVKKGTKGLGDMLRTEAAIALEQRRQRAEKEGEKTGTRLLAPMFVMLCIVLVIVIVPAFLSVYSTM